MTGATVLIADDEQGLLDIFVEVISGRGHKAVAATDGDAALTLARQHHPNLILADYMMPRRTGLELLRALRTENGFGRVPVVLMSAGRPRGVEEAWRFLSKPISLEDLENVVNEGLSMNGAGRTAAKPLNVSPLALAREDMLNWVAHEIRSPLGTALLSIAVLDRQLSERAADLKPRAETVRRQLVKMNELVTSILEAASLEDGQITLRRAIWNVNDFVTEVVDDWRQSYLGVTIALRPALENAPVLIDRVRMRQVLDNLVSNAIKYAGAEKPIEIVVDAVEDQVTISVVDRGPGIPPEQAARVFDRFYRADDSPGRGHGLGLYIAAAVTRLHGGSLKLASEPGVGSTFTVHLTRAVQPPGQP